jgi:hypothetical protein
VGDFSFYLIAYEVYKLENYIFYSIGRDIDAVSYFKFLILLFSSC